MAIDESALNAFIERAVAELSASFSVPLILLGDRLGLYQAIPVFLPGAHQLMSAMMHDEPKISAAFRTGDGVGWHEHYEELYPGTERFFRPGYNANLVSAWLPALDGAVEKLVAGALVADVGCGHGASTIILAQSWHTLALDATGRVVAAIAADRWQAATPCAGWDVRALVS